MNFSNLCLLMKRFFTINESIADLAARVQKGETIVIHERDLEEEDVEKVHQFFWLTKMWSNRLDPLLKHLQDYFVQQGISFRYVVKKVEQVNAGS